MERLSPEGSQQLAKDARRLLLEAVSKSSSAHVGSALSVVDILAVAYSVLDIAPEKTPGGDTVILSKGHAAAALYSVLALKGFFPLDWLDRYSSDGAELGGHVTSGVPGVNFSTGSLGHGLPFGTGVALAAKRQGGRRIVTVVLSDGELNEGSNWEAMMLAAHHRLNNLRVLVDRNGLQSLKSTEDTVRLEPLEAKFKAFGWDCWSIDGHDHEEIANSLTEKSTTERPRMIIANTVKGKGVSFMENQVRWHYRPPNHEELAAALREVSAS